MIARDVDGVDPVHRGGHRSTVRGQQDLAAGGPGIERLRLSEQRPRGAGGQRAEETREIDRLRPHQLQDVLRQSPVRRGDPELRRHALGPVTLVVVSEPVQHLRGRLNRGLAVVVEQRQQGLRQPGQVPLQDVRLVAIGIAAALVDGAEHRGRVEGVHERTRAIVDGLARNRRVVGVHNPVHRATSRACAWTTRRYRSR